MGQDALGGLTTLPHRGDDQIRAADHVAAGEDLGVVGLERELALFLDPDPFALIDADAVVLEPLRRVGPKTEGDDPRSAGRTCSLPGTTSGCRRPRSSGAPSRVSTTLAPSTRSSPTISTGWRLKRNSTPSSLAL